MGSSCSFCSRSAAAFGRKTQLDYKLSSFTESGECSNTSPGVQNSRQSSLFPQRKLKDKQPTFCSEDLPFGRFSSFSQTYSLSEVTWCFGTYTRPKVQFQVKTEDSEMVLLRGTRCKSQICSFGDKKLSISKHKTERNPKFDSCSGISSFKVLSSFPF